jgi:hypothetical protein
LRRDRGMAGAPRGCPLCPQMASALGRHQCSPMR